MLRRVLNCAPGVARVAQTPSRGSFQLVLRDVKYLLPASCASSPTQHIPGQANSITGARSYATGSLDSTETTEYTNAAPAAAPSKSRGRPKKDGSGSTKKTTAKKPGPKPKSTEKNVAPNKKKPAAKKKPATKKKPTLKKPRAKKVVQGPRAKVQELKQLALLQSPRMLPGTAYLAFMVEQYATGADVRSQSKDIAEKYRALSSSEREHYQNIATQNKIANAKTRQTWIEGYTPDEIRIANNARRQLNRIAKGPIPEGKQNRQVGRTFHLINDVRAVKLTDRPFAAYMRERWASGEFKGVPVREATVTLGVEWKGLNEGEKQKYRDAYAVHKEQYEKDYNAMFTRRKRSPPTTPVAVIPE